MEYPLWKHFVSDLLSKSPDLTYPEPTEQVVHMGAACGIGHRLVRNARIYHLARTLGYQVHVFWFPFRELFEDLPFLQASVDVHDGFRFTNEAGPIMSIMGSTSEMIRIEDLKSDDVIHFDLSSHSNKNAWRRFLFNVASKDYIVNFHITLLTLLREKWIRRIESFLNHLSHNYLIGLHVRTGNNEGGDFDIKNRQLDLDVVLEKFNNEIMHRSFDHEPVVLLATDNPRVVEWFDKKSSLRIVRFALDLPSNGIITGQFSRGIEQEFDKASRVKGFFEAYADMCLLGYCQDLYLSSWSAFTIGSVIFNRLRHDTTGSIRNYDDKDGLWKPC